MTYGHIHFSVKSWVLLYQLLHIKVLRTGFGLSCVTSWSQLMWSLFKAVPVPGAIFHFPYMNQQKVVNHCYRLNGNPIFPHNKIFSALIMVYASWHHVMLKAKQALCLIASWLVSFMLCLGDQSICFADFYDRHPSMGSKDKEIKIKKPYLTSLYLTGSI